MIDSHCHLDFPEFDTDREEVLKKAAEAGVTQILNPGCNLETSRKAVALADFVSQVVAAVGVHPSNAAELDTAAMSELAKLAEQEQVVAIGEIGLDYKNPKTDKVVQKDAFIHQLALAEKLDKPVIIHSRDAERECVEIIKRMPKLRGVFHCYTGSLAPAIEAVGLGFYVGFTGIVTYKNAALVQEAVQAVPLERILIETDAPFLAPELHRGKRCEPAFVVEVAQKIAEIKGLELAEVEKATTENARQLFGI